MAKLAHNLHLYCLSETPSSPAPMALHIALAQEVNIIYYIKIMLARCESNLSPKIQQTYSSWCLFTYLQDILETKVDFIKLPTDSSGQYRIQVNFLPSAIQPVKDQPDVTLVTHCTSNHLHYLLDLAKHWKGPISLGMFCCSFVIMYLKS